MNIRKCGVWQIYTASSVVVGNYATSDLEEVELLNRSLDEFWRCKNSNHKLILKEQSESFSNILRTFARVCRGVLAFAGISCLKDSLIAITALT